VQVIEGVAHANEAGPAFANVAESVIGGLLRTVENELAAHAGRVPGGAFAVVAMGKLGGREMTASSDLDLIFVYDAPAGAETSDGDKKLPVTVYYARLAQRLIAALTTLTAEGRLYDVDMRLRPTGNKGPVAVSLESFARYHATESWAWERMALTRARIIAGPADLAHQVEDVVHAALTKRGDDRALVKDAREMREKLAAQFPGRNAWDLKFAPGGLVDIEFVVQALQLRAGVDAPQCFDTNTVSALVRLATADLLDRAVAGELVAAARLQHALNQVLRIAVDGVLEPDKATPKLKQLLARAGGAPDFATLETELAATQLRVREIFNEILPVVW
jgi:glutamate-ammonia-ligase adenylyltransferase